jgi:hypothetical protein
MPSIFFSRTSSAMCEISFTLLTWYGISVTTIASRPLSSSSISHFARIVRLPRPVL